MDINVVVLTGKIVREPDAKYTKKGRPKCHVTVSCQTLNPFGYPETVFIGVDGWNEVGEWMMENVDKGDEILVEGSYLINSFEGDEGKKIYIHSVVAKSVRNLSNPEVAEVEEEEEVIKKPAPKPKTSYPKPATRQRKATRRAPAPKAELDEEDIPEFDGDDNED